VIYDDHNNSPIGEFSFRSNIRAIKLSKRYFVVVLEHEISVYSFVDNKLIHQIETTSNPNGLCCLSYHTDTSVMACPGMSHGLVRVEHFGLNLTKFITAHHSNISCMAMTVDGIFLATASVKGTLIRIFNTMDGTCLQEVRL
jgi:WD40 repeat protein